MKVISQRTKSLSNKGLNQNNTKLKLKLTSLNTIQTETTRFKQISDNIQKPTITTTKEVKHTLSSLNLLSSPNNNNNNTNNNHKRSFTSIKTLKTENREMQKQIEALKHENQTLKEEIKELKYKLANININNNVYGFNQSVPNLFLVNNKTNLSSSSINGMNSKQNYSLHSLSGNGNTSGNNIMTTITKAPLISRMEKKKKQLMLFNMNSGSHNNFIMAPLNNNVFYQNVNLVQMSENNYCEGNVLKQIHKRMLKVLNLYEKICHRKENNHIVSRNLKLNRTNSAQIHKGNNCSHSNTSKNHVGRNFSNLNTDIKDIKYKFNTKVPYIKNNNLTIA